MNLKEYVKEKKYTSRTDYYSYANYVQSILATYQSINAEDKEILDLIEVEKQMVRNRRNFVNKYQKQNLSILNIKPNSAEDLKIMNWLINYQHEGYDGILLESLLNKFPVFYVNEKLCELLANTDYPWDIPLSKLFIPDAVFLFPKNNIFNLRSCTISSNYYEKYHCGYDINGSPDFVSEDFKEQWKGKEEEEKYKDTDILISAFYKNKEITNRAVCTWNSKTRCLEKILSLPSESSSCVIVSSKGQYLYSERKLHEPEYLKKIIPQIFLYMSIYQQNLEPIISPISSGFSSKPSKKRAYLTPRMIGEEFTQKNDNVTRIGMKGIGLGVKKATHWRRGHWRRINEDKLTWIRPTLINANAS